MGHRPDGIRSRILRRRDAISLQLGLQASAALFTTPLVWIGLGSYARVLGLLYLFYGLALLGARAGSSVQGAEAGAKILEQGGSVQHLDFLSEDEKAIFKTSFEIDQRWLIELAADRTPYIDQATSLNLFIPADVDKWDLMMLHFRAWELGIKSLYYLRSKSVQRAGFAGGVEADNTPELKEIPLASSTDYDECLACQ